MRSNQRIGAPRTWRELVRRATFAVTAVAVMAGLAAVTTTATLVGSTRQAAAVPMATTFFYTGTNESWTVPDGVTEATFDIVGGHGGRGADHALWVEPDGILGGGRGGAGGHGAHIRATVNVVPGEVYRIVVGGNGGSASGPSDEGLGAWGYCSYASKGNDGDGAGGAGGGGGGATAVYRNGSLVAVAGGGGGGGGGGHGMRPYTEHFHAGSGGDAGYHTDMDGEGGIGPGDNHGGTGGGTSWCGGTGGDDAAFLSSGGGGGGGGAGTSGGTGGGGGGLGGGGGGGGGAGDSEVNGLWAPILVHPDTNPGNGYVQIRFNQAFTSWLDVYDRSGPVDVGEPVVVQASLVTASGADWDSRAGTITWKVGGDVVGTQVLENSADPFPIPGLGAGTHTVVAEFTPRYPADLEPSTGSVEVQVNQGRAALVISSGPNPSVTGQPVTLSATAAAIAPAPGTPSGEVQFMADGAPLGVPVALDPAGQASLTTDELAVGVRSISATYNGDATFLPATSAPLTHVVNTGDVAMTVAPAPSPSVVNETVTFTATMEAVRPASGVPGGTVTFTIDGIDLPPATVAADGTAGTSVSYLAAGNHDVIATYSGDASFNPAAAATTHAVNKGDVSVALTQSAPTSSSGEAVDFTAVVEPQIDGVAPTGVVHFYVGGSFVGAAELSAGGVATLSTSALAVGVNQITARYEGDRVWSETFANLVEHTVTDGSAPGTDPGGEPGSEDPGEDPGEGTDTSPTDPTDPDGGDVDPDDPSDGDADPGDGHLDDLDDLGDRQDPDGDVLGDGDGHAAGDGDPARPLARTGTAVLASTLGGLVIAAGGFLLMAAGRRRREA